MGTQIIANEPVVLRTERDRAPIEAPPGERARVLVVEDEYLVALDIQRGLERMGHTAVVVYSGEQAVVQASTTRFDLILMDIKLTGDLDGIDAADRIHAMSDVPVIYLTAYADNQTLSRARLTEPYGYVLKPFQERELRAAIDMALRRHAMDRQRQQQQREQQFLSTASARLAASLDFRALAADATALLVPEHADWCMLQLQERDDSVPAYTHVTPGTPPESADAMRDAIRSASNAATSTGVMHVDDLTLIALPLRARGETLGALALACDPGRIRFRDADALWAEDFAQRLAMALDNALLYRKAERAIQMRDDVLAIVSHDLRSPLGTILMQAELLADRPDIGRAGMQIVRSVQLMNRLIGDLLDASAINAGRLTLDHRCQRVTAIVQEAVDMFRSQADAAGIELRERSVEARVICDTDRIVQVLSNLIGNALKFTPRGGLVVVSATRIGSDIQLEVCDTGRGIAPEQVPHLFDRFWRGKAERHGAGLGLFIARGIIASHGSKLELETQLGKGSRFYFKLPEVRA